MARTQRFGDYEAVEGKLAIDDARAAYVTKTVGGDNLGPNAWGGPSSTRPRRAPVASFWSYDEAVRHAREWSARDAGTDVPSVPASEAPTAELLGDIAEPAARDREPSPHLLQRSMLPSTSRSGSDVVAGDDAHNPPERYLKGGAVPPDHQRAAPHGRDYYVQGEPALDVAMAEHRHRLDKLSAIQLELEAIAEGIADQWTR